MQRCVLLFLLFLLTPSMVLAGGTGEPAKKEPIGVVTDDNGERILVGIGTDKPLATLDVSRGEIKLGSTGAVCTHGLAGTLRYAASRLQFCDGMV